MLKDTCLIGPDYDDFAAIYDRNGNVICDGGEYQDIIFGYGNSKGVGVILKPSESTGTADLKGYVIDADGNKLSEELDYLTATDES